MPVGDENTKLYQGLSWLYFTRRGCHHRCSWIRILISTRIRWRWLQVLRRRSFCWLRWRGQFGDWYPLRWCDRFDMMIFSRLFWSRVRVMEFIRGQTAFKSVTGDRWYVTSSGKTPMPLLFSGISSVYACINFNLVPIAYSFTKREASCPGAGARFRIPLPLPWEIGCINLTRWKCYHWHHFPVTKLFSTSFDSSRCQYVTYR